MRLPVIPLLFIVLPLAEIAAFVVVGSEIGALATVGLVIVTTFIGAILLRIQGFGALNRIRSAMETGASPGHDMVNGAMIMLAGILLILPGFITDAFGLLLFIPPVRDLVWRFLSRHIVVVNAGARGYSARSSRTIDLDEEDFSRRDSPRPDRPSIEDDR